MWVHCEGDFQTLLMAVQIVANFLEILEFFLMESYSIFSFISGFFHFLMFKVFEIYSCYGIQ